MIRQLSLSSLFAVVALLIMVALTGCAKEEGFAPCKHENEQVEGAKSRGGDNINDVDAVGKPELVRGTGEGSSISDDGDDVGDGERNKKKKPAN